MVRPLVMVILNYNDAVTTKRLLENVRDYPVLTKIFVVDNCSTDHSYLALKKLATNKIEVVKTEKNNGFAAGLNASIRMIKKQYKKVDIIFSNADVIVYSNENLQLLQTRLQKEHLGMLGPTICEQGKLNRGWKLLTPRQEVLTNIPMIGGLLKRRYQTYDDTHYQTKFSIVDAVSGCFFLMSLETLEKVGYFDENTFLYYEENIMAKKLKKINMSCAVDNEVTIIHDHSVSVDKSVSYINKFKILKESQYYFEKNYNHARPIDLFLLKLTSKLTLMTLYIRIFFKGGFRK